ncbi:MAG: ATP-dependent DNA helicase RecG [Thermoanaerobaculia bacterium]
MPSEAAKPVQPQSRTPRTAVNLTAETPLVELRGIGPVRSRELEAAGYRVVRDLLLHLPFRYEDRRSLEKVNRVDAEGSYLLSGRLEKLSRVRLRRRGMSMVRGRLVDDTGELPVVWFNRPYLLEQISPEKTYLLYGGVRRRAEHWELLNPTCEPADEALHSGRIVPVYSALGKLGSKALRRLMDQILDQIQLDKEFTDRLPGDLLDNYSLPSLATALATLHRPEGEMAVDRLNERKTPAHERLIYGEFLKLQLELAVLRSLETRERKAHRHVWEEPTQQLLGELLPFSLTAAQQRVLGEIREDMSSPHPMLRLLQGDVGSGKTIVAALALTVALESGHQGVFMAPTEILAEQHHRTLERLLGKRFRVALLTSSSPDQGQLRRELAAGRIQLAVGTHALIQESVSLRRLGLAVIDEQHRFGVAQRRLLQNKGVRPDLLVMTATPIPRSLALTAYGDLALSVIDELPPGRSPISTRVVARSSRPAVYRWLRRRLDRGAQAYVVFPLIDDSERIDAAAVSGFGEEVRALLSRHRSEILHGRSSREERARIMSDFAAGEVKVLVATTLVEVGLDVPRATIMIIESAERFGLSQLHQLRGRIGRGSEPSTCIAIHGRLSSDSTARRLNIFASSTDGFRVAEADLEIRGPGDLLGTRQSGVPLFRVADLVADREWLEIARKDAREILESSGQRDDLRPLLAAAEKRAADRQQQFAGG